MNAIQTLRQRVVAELRENDGSLPESSDNINDASRAVVAEYAKNYGTAWLGRVNRYEEDAGKPDMWEWDGGLIYNFGASFVAPRYDETLVQMIQKRNAAPYTGTQKDYADVTAIMDRLELIGGTSLIWT